MERCEWAANDLMISYHDEEWGVPLHDDRLLFEFLILEGAQAGLSWNTILNKRENCRSPFDNFDLLALSKYGDAKGRRRRYRRQDRVGTPYCVTIDFDTIDDNQVTIRDRDSMHQSRVPVSELVEILKDKLEHAW